AVISYHTRTGGSRIPKIEENAVVGDVRVGRGRILEKVQRRCNLPSLNYNGRGGSGRVIEEVNHCGSKRLFHSAENLQQRVISGRTIGKIDDATDAEVFV